MPSEMEREKEDFFFKIKYVEDCLLCRPKWNVKKKIFWVDQREFLTPLLFPYKSSLNLWVLVRALHRAANGPYTTFLSKINFASRDRRATVMQM